ncbi:helix-turn-helix transcriptional regulator [Streptomyces sp. ADMS]|uniref:helix-turn-helix transcriptional regulator n=1 Tax=Streptomyces sp. ADMS TaxID=3071415 RepID=UPI00296F1B95|nr:helix-turn-helix transcriptional regulator [Streptomyces sp. ADMS]MDW4908717.1 helix-turn-helix transcriptional regulator [Streptomyces sp. ADMS]
MTPAPHPDHGLEELCEPASTLYQRALREGHVPSADAANAPCLVDLGLLHPAVDDLDRLEPVAPSVALHRLLRGAGERIAAERRREERLTELFEPLLRVETPGMRTDTPTINVLLSNKRTNQAITEAMATASQELLSVQPNCEYGTENGRLTHSIAMDRDQALLDRGARIRTLYQATTLHQPLVFARYEKLSGDAEARFLDEVTDRILIIDRTVAFISDRTRPTGSDIALEIRQPAIIAYFVSTFERLWQLATPMYPQSVHRPSLNGVTPRQRAIAALLVEGHTDAVIATRLGMNVRTARVHIAKLAATLGSESRAQLGYLIGQSGILEPESESGQRAGREPSAPEG